MAISNNTTGYRPGVCTSSTRPSAPYEGQMIFETDTNRVLVWDNAAWVMIADTDSPPGLQLVKTQTVGTAVTSVTVNGAFSSEFENYKVVLSGGQSSSAVDLNLQLTAGGTPSTTLYYGVLVWASRDTGSVAGATNNNASVWSWAGGSAGSADGAASMDVDLLNPFDAKRTRLHNAQVLYSTVYGTYTGLHDIGTSYDGIKIIPSSGTLTGGTIRVYGYRN